MIHDSMPGFSLRAWSAWAPGRETRQDWLDWCANPGLPVGDTAPAAAFLPPMLRRRAMRLGRMAIESLAPLAAELAADTPVVFASRHGETHRSLALMRELLAEGNVSPQSFSLSVHNASVGLYTIARQCHANVTALAGGNATSTALLTEAIGLLGDGAPSVLLVACDEILPECYGAYADEPQATYSWAAELVAGHDFVLSPATQRTQTPELPDMLGLFHFLIDPTRSDWHARTGAMQLNRRKIAA